MIRIVLLTIAASIVCLSTAQAQSGVRVRDSVSRKFQAEKGFFEPAKNSSLKPMFSGKSKPAIYRLLRVKRR